MSAAAQAVPATTPIGQDFPVKLIRVSKTNPRKSFDKAQLADLAASIKEKGILQPLLCRPWPGSNLEGALELVAGERRLRAALQVGLETVPVIVRNLSDADALEVQVIENLQRADLHPLEEAEGYEQLQKLHGYGVEDLAAKVGKSKAYVYARLKLTALVPLARKAFYEGKLNPSTALYVARIPDQKLQEKAVKEITDRHGEPMTARQAFDFIQREFMLRLHDAPFRKDDAQLVPAAGPCTTCPKRTGNQKELFSDIQSADVCTDPTCFRKKVDEHWAQRVAEHKAKGGEVLQGSQLKAVYPDRWNVTPAYNSGFVALDEACREDPKFRTYRALLGKQAADQVVLARHPEGEVKELLPRAAARKALVEKGYDFAKKKPSGAGERSSRLSKADAEKEALKVAIEERADLLGWLAVAAAAEKAGPSPEVLRFLAWAAVDRLDWHLPVALLKARYGIEQRGSFDKLKKLVAGMKPPQLVGLLAAFALTSFEYDDDADGGRLEEACKRFKIDLKKLASEARAQVEAERATAAKAPGKATKKAKRT